MDNGIILNDILRFLSSLQTLMVIQKSLRLPRMQQKLDYSPQVQMGQLRYFEKIL